MKHSTAAQLGELGGQHQPAVFDTQFGAHRATRLVLPGDARKHATTTAERAATELCAPLVAYHPVGDAAAAPAVPTVASNDFELAETSTVGVLRPVGQGHNLRHHSVHL